MVAVHDEASSVPRYTIALGDGTQQGASHTELSATNVFGSPANFVGRGGRGGGRSKGWVTGWGAAWGGGRAESRVASGEHCAGTGTCSGAAGDAAAKSKQLWLTAHYP